MKLIDADALLENVSGTKICSEIQTLIHNMTIFSPPPNEPLTLPELQEMDGKPVWIKCIPYPDLSCWGIRYRYGDCVDGYHAIFRDENYNKTWLAYRQKPEDEK